MKILYVTTIGTTMGFFESFIHECILSGHTVDIACNDTDSKVKPIYYDWGCNVYTISCTRSPLNRGTLKAIKELKKIVEDNKYDIVHCHTPIAAMCTRLACRKARKKGTKVLYTAHGFHFYKGAPMKNWLLYYPIEKICSYFTDMIITINQEDFELAKMKMYAKSVEYVPGVGVDIERFSAAVVNREEIRNEINVPKDALLMLSVGELNHNKNHEVVIRAMSKLKNPNIHYAIAGRGELHNYLETLAEELGLTAQIHLLGFRPDIAQLYKASDICVFPSIREGLGLAAIEGMAAGLPLIVSDNRGTRDYAKHEINALVCIPQNVDMFAQAISRMMSDDELRHRMGIYNVEASRSYRVSKINEIMKELYTS